MSSLRSSIDKLVGIAACIATAIVVALVAVEVVARYGFGSSISFAQEAARLMFVWAVFLGLPLALSRGRHVGIGIVDASAPAGVARQVRRIAALLSMGLLAVVAWKSVEVMVFNWDQTLNTIPLSAGLFYLPVVVGCAISILYLVELAITGKRRLIDTTEDL